MYMYICIYMACQLRVLAGDAQGLRGFGVTSRPAAQRGAPQQRGPPGPSAAPPEQRREGAAAPAKGSEGDGGSEPTPRSAARGGGGGGDTPCCSPMGTAALPFLPFPFSTPSPGLGRREAAALQPGCRRQPRTAPSPPPQKHLRGGRMPGGGRHPRRERGLASEPPRRGRGGGGRGEEEKGTGGKWGSCALPAPPRAGAMGPAGGVRAAPSLLLSLLLGASAPLWLRAEKLGECGGRAGRGSGMHGPPRGAPSRPGEQRWGAGVVWGGGPRRPRLVAPREPELLSGLYIVDLVNPRRVYPRV